jgi:hypothetical protein
MSITQAKRLSYTRRDLMSYHDDVSRYIKGYIPRVTDASESNAGRLTLTLTEALVDNANYSIDQIHLESQLKNAVQRKNILELARMLGYYPSSVSYASVDLTYTLLSGVAPGGGYPIPIYTRSQTTVSPVIEFYTSGALTILEGESSGIISAIQGTRIIGEVLSASSTGIPNQSYTFRYSKTPHDLVEIYVNSKKWTLVNDFYNTDDESEVYTLTFDENDYTSVIFGDGTMGKAPSIGATIEGNYVIALADQGNADVATVNRVIGSLASTVSVTNVAKASGGATSETNASVKINAPAHRATFDRFVTKSDYEAAATAVTGVYKGFASTQEGARTDIYILPEGGGIASSLLISNVQSYIDARKVEGAVPVIHSLQNGYIAIAVNLITFDNKIQKSIIKQKAQQATLDNLDYRMLTRGRGFTISDLSGIYENLDSGTLIDYADFSMLTRIPRVVQSNLSAPSMVGRVNVFDTSGYDEYLVTALTTSTYVVTKNGIPDPIQGTVAIPFTTNGGEISFTLGVTGDVFVVNDTWRFKTSKYRDNIVLDADEIMVLEKLSDLSISVFYPGEYNIKTKASI